MEPHLKVLFIDAGSAFYRTDRFKVGTFFGPVDLGLHLAGKHNSLNIGTGLLAGSIFPGTSRLIFNGFSPAWGGFYISSMGGAGLVFENLGINMLSVVGKAPVPSIVYLNRTHAEEIHVEVTPVDLNSIWKEGRRGLYALMDHTYKIFGERYATDPRILAVGPAARSTDIGAIASVPITNGKLSHVDTWAGRGGFGSKLLQDHGIAAIIYGGSFIDEDFRDRKVADAWFVDKYQKKLAAKDIESTTKYRFDPKLQTGGTFGVNYTTLAGRMLFFNYRSIYLEEADRLEIHKKFILEHYLKQFNEETIVPKKQRHCGEPCAAVCKKMHGEYKKDYEPYQALGPLSGIFDQRAAEKLNHHADMYGFDAISVGGVVAWLMECLGESTVTPQELGVSGIPVFKLDEFDVAATSLHNAAIGVQLLDAIIEKRGILDLSQGARKFARRLSRRKGDKVRDCFVYTAYARKGWMVPNQYWTPGVLSPMSIMGKYYMHYDKDFLPPREVGRFGARRLQSELIMDNLGCCRFHRSWAEEMLPDIMGSLFDLKKKYLENCRITASRISSRNASIYWESQRNIDYIQTFLIRQHVIEGNNDPELLKWIENFATDRQEAALSYWYEIHKGIQESLREF